MAELHFLAEQFRPTKAFSFPKRRFGSKGEERSFRAEWCDMFSWLHYDVDKDAAFCFLCMRCEAENKFLASTKRELCMFLCCVDIILAIIIIYAAQERSGTTRLNSVSSKSFKHR